MTSRPPHNIWIMVCPVCGRDDRYRPFVGKAHHWRGKKCPGVPERVDYELVNPNAPYQKGI